MERIVIIGATGSGKSTLGRLLGDKLGYPVIELDDLYWSPGWVAADRDKFRAVITKESAGDKWIAVGNYSMVSDILWHRADTLIWMDGSLLSCLTRLIRRTIRRAQEKTPICNGNFETIARAFSGNSLILWLFKTYYKKKREFGAVFSAKSQPGVRNYIRLRTPRETEAFLSSL